MNAVQPTPKFAAIAEVLRRRIREGIYTPGDRLPSSNALPTEFGVGKQTVVRALSELAREGLIVSKQGLGTFVAPELPRASGAAQTVRPRKIAILFRRNLSRSAVALQGWFGQVVAGVAEGLGFDADALALLESKHGAHEPGRAHLRQAGHPHAVELIGEPRAIDTGVPLRELFRAEPDAILPVSVFDDEYLRRMVDTAAVRGVPVVLVDYWTRALGARTDCVVADNQPGYMAACEWFIGRGMRRIHFVGAYSVSHTPGHFRAGAHRQGRIEPDSYLRQAAWRQAMDEAGLEAPTHWAHVTSSMKSDLEELAAKLCALSADERPEALLCHNAAMAAHLRKACEARDVKLEALGVDEPDQHTPLTLSGHELGRAAAALALARIEEKEAGVTPRPYFKAAVPTRFLTRA